MTSLPLLPNLLSLFRLIGAPIVFVLLIKQNPISAALLFLCASSSDWVDGYLARRFSWQSQLGGLLDPIADKLLIFLTYLALCLTNALPWWLFLLVISRDALILFTSLIVLWRRWRISLVPSWLSKFNTAVQFGLILDLLTKPIFPNLPSTIFFENELIYTVAVTTILSGIDYAYRFWQQFSGR